MSESTAKHFENLIPLILKNWEIRARKHVLSAKNLESLTLRDSLPKLLEQIVRYLGEVEDEATIRSRHDELDGLNIGKEHGAERAGLMTYTMDQMVFEYHILRQVVFDLTREKLKLNDLEREIILCAIEHAVTAAATKFNDQMKSMQERLAQNFTHDLRGPLTAARMSAERIARLKDKPERCAQQASRVISGLDRIDQIVEDLLDSSLVQVGQPLVLSYLTCDLYDVARSVCDTACDAYGDRFVLKGKTSLVGEWCEQAVYRILQNLVTNAVKYGLPDTPITISVAHNKTQAHFEVHNFGIVIPKEDWGILFERYQQGCGERRQGYGLGLTVVKGLVEAHNGEIRVESEEESGTTFSIDLSPAVR
jgi:signal transduction histidine kinase